jgi:hypothetical protein
MAKTERKTAKARIDRRMKDQLSELGREWELQLRQSLEGSADADGDSTPGDDGQTVPPAQVI